MKRVSDIAPEVLKKVREGVAIPAQVLALDENRRFAPKYQRALTRYFIDCGVGGIAVGVHSTQFAIRDPKVGLFKPVLSETSRFIDEWCERQGKKILKVGGVCGRTEQAVAEAEFEAAGVNVLHSGRFSVIPRPGKNFLRISVSSAGSAKNLKKGLTIVRGVLEGAFSDK